MRVGERILSQEILVEKSWCFTVFIFVAGVFGPL